MKKRAITFLDTLMTQKEDGTVPLLMYQKKTLTDQFLNVTYHHTNKIPKLWRQARIVAILKPGNDPDNSKSFQPIALLCHTSKLYERVLLNRPGPFVDQRLIPQQASFKPGKSCTSQLMNLIQFIEDGYEKG